MKLDNENLMKCNDAVMVFNYFLTLNNITVGYNAYYHKNKMIPLNNLFSRYSIWCKINRVKSFIHTRKTIDETDNIIQHETLEQLKSDLADRLNVKPKSNDMAEWLKLQKLTNWTDNDIMVYQATLWKIKRQCINDEILNNYQVPMPVIFSTNQGWGKTTFNRAIENVLGELSMQRPLSDVQDSKNYQIWSDMFMINFDDISDQSDREISAYKFLVTNDKINTRLMHNHKNISAYKLFCGVASSNKKVSEIMPDKTGSRRMWEIKLSKPLFDAVDNIDFLELYREIDHTSLCDLLDPKNYSKILTIQHDKQKSKHIVEYWFDDWVNNTNFDKHENDISQAVYDKIYPSFGLYKHFEHWCNNNNEILISNTKFSPAIVQHLDQYFIKNKRNAKGNSFTYIKK